MAFRVTANTFARNAIHFSNLQNQQLFRAQRQIASGAEFEVPSDQPLGYRQVRALQTRVSQMDSEISVIQRATSNLNASVSNLEEVNSILTNARNLVLQGIQSIEGVEREALASEAEPLLERLEAIANSQHHGEYLYGGSRSETEPFAFTAAATANHLVDAQYQGTSLRGQAHIGDALSVDMYYDGREIFGAPGRDQTLVIGTTGAAHGGGTDSLQGRMPLEVTHIATTYAAGSGVAPGTDSVAEDTIVGPMGAYMLTVIDLAGDGSSGTVALNDGTPVAFTNADTNLRVIGPGGEQVFVDTSAITAGFNGTIDIESTATLSIDNGLTTIPVTHAGDQQVVDSATGRYTTIDSTNIRRTGTDSVEFPGSSNLFQVLDGIQRDIRNQRGLSVTEYAAALNRRLGELDEIANNILHVIGEQSSALQTMESLQTRVEDMKQAAEVEINDLQVTDFPSAVLNLETNQTMLQYTYAVTASVTSIDLISFLG